MLVIVCSLVLLDIIWLPFCPGKALAPSLCIQRKTLLRSWLFHLCRSGTLRLIGRAGSHASEVTTVSASDAAEPRLPARGREPLEPDCGSVHLPVEDVTLCPDARR